MSTLSDRIYSQKKHALTTATHPNFTSFLQNKCICFCIPTQVLATDMSKHIEHVAHLKTMVEVRRLTGNNRLELENNDDKLRVGMTIYIENYQPIIVAFAFVDMWLPVIGQSPESSKKIIVWIAKSGSLCRPYSLRFPFSYRSCKVWFTAPTWATRRSPWIYICDGRIVSWRSSTARGTRRGGSAWTSAQCAIVTTRTSQRRRFVYVAAAF